jgi:transposase
VGRPSIAPERLLRSRLLQIFYSVRSERMLIAAAVQLVVPVVCGDGDGRGGMESRGVQQEPGRLLNEEIAEGFFRRVLGTCKAAYVG